MNHRFCARLTCFELNDSIEQVALQINKRGALGVDRRVVLELLNGPTQYVSGFSILCVATHHGSGD